MSDRQVAAMYDAADAAAAFANIDLANGEDGTQV